MAKKPTDRHFTLSNSQMIIHIKIKESRKVAEKILDLSQVGEYRNIWILHRLKDSM